jgi:type II secretory pathway pseudopilin PulG
MNKLSTRGAAKGLTFVEVLVVIGVVVILMALLLPATVGNRPSMPNTQCLNSLRQIGLALRMFADDNNGKLPPQVSITNGGSMELIGSNSPALHFGILSNYLGGRLRLLHCPADQSKQPLTNQSALTDRNLSYFISMDATLALPSAIQAGDRNLQVAGQPVAPGLFTLTTNAVIGWTRDLHTLRQNVGWVESGNLLFADGGAQRLKADLPVAIQHQGLATNRLAVP